jgi:hypothetical protein
MPSLFIKTDIDALCACLFIEIAFPKNKVDLTDVNWIKHSTWSNTKALFTRRGGEQNERRPLKCGQWTHGTIDCSATRRDRSTTASVCVYADGQHSLLFALVAIATRVQWHPRARVDSAVCATRSARKNAAPSAIQYEHSGFAHVFWIHPCY